MADRRSGVAEVERDHRQRVERGDVPRLPLDQRLEQLRRRLVPPLLPRLGGLGEQVGLRFGGGQALPSAWSEASASA